VRVNRNDGASHHSRAVNRSVLHRLRERQKRNARQKIYCDPPGRITVDEVLRLRHAHTSCFRNDRFDTSILCIGDDKRPSAHHYDTLTYRYDTDTF
jgi:hypothetical protein